jgi:hypothetical protein
LGRAVGGLGSKDVPLGVDLVDGDGFPAGPLTVCAADGRLFGFWR